MKPKTLFEKIWEKHIVHKIDKNLALLYIDIHFIHEVTSPVAFADLRRKKLKVRRAHKTFATCDHNVSTRNQEDIKDPFSKLQVETLKRNCHDFGIKLFGLDSPYQGIAHVIGPELGITQPGKTIVCGDSHTSTHGAFGALAFGIGTTEVEHVLASQCLLQTSMNTMEVRIDGKLQKGVTAKDVILTILAKIGTKGGAGYALEYTGEVILNMNMEERMTICNMSIEAGAKIGLIAPDEVTFNYLKDKPFAPQRKDFEKALSYWKTLKTDDGAIYDKQISINADKLKPMITYGTNPSSAIDFDEVIPDPKNAGNQNKQQTMEKALKYMNLHPGMRLSEFPIDYVFIGSCTNSRITDLRDAAKIIKGMKVKKGVTAFVVPGSRQVKKQAEKEGLDKLFKSAGFSWRLPGCSACIGINGDTIPSGKYCIATNNRNFEGRQGPGARTFLASPIMAAAASIEGKITDVRKYL